ncbi:hypothetical protein QR680_010051 [Steinernema hermaphroditum]|uniref:Uncharacterized protein n=1 Tax=Steinernema hermaphroditum TaxID=289476 RepID=A0AA39INT4_9BILA|nr:hypothetical protein QR680_010051 [Steinernema hermaphroditum]
MRFVVLGLLALRCPSSFASASSEETVHWNEFRRAHGRSYASPTEEQRRFQIFVDNLRQAKKRADMEEGTATFGWNQFSDMTTEEFAKLYLMDREALQSSKPNYTEPRPISLYQGTELPASFDWRDHGVVSEVKNQGNCPSCWIFSAVQNVESVYAVKKGKLYSLSEQQLIDCRAGCSSGWSMNALRNIRNMGGLERESDYRYTGVGGSCRYNRGKAVLNIDGAISLAADEYLIAQHLVHYGPISVAFNARDSIMHYKGGIVKISSCGHVADHSVLLVGYGSENGIPYWIVKNSWGKWWGEKGYFRMYRGRNTCGIANHAVTAVVN